MITQAPEQVIWRKSSRSSDQGGECVEVGKAPANVLVRDTKLGQGSPVLQVTRSDWASLTEAISR